MAKRRLLDRLPVVHQLRQSVGLQRGMLVAGLVLTGDLPAVRDLRRPGSRPYGYNQLRGPDGNFGAQQPPSAEHLLGTTVGGYDVLSRTIWGAQTALLVIVVAIALSVFLGILLGLVSGYLGGWVDRTLVVIADAIYAFPTLLLAIVAAIAISGGQSGLWPGVLAAAISITVVFIPQYFRVVRAEVVRVKSEAFVESAKVIGASTPRIMFVHVLRNATRSLPLIVTLNASEAISTLAALGFLGFGIEPTAAAEWGYDLKQVHRRCRGRHLVDRDPARYRDRARRSSASRSSARASTTSPTRACARADASASATPADAVAATQPVAREFMGEVE